MFECFVYLVLNANDVPAILDLLRVVEVNLLDVRLHLSALERRREDSGEERRKVLAKALGHHDKRRLEVVNLRVVGLEDTAHSHHLLHDLQRVSGKDLLPNRDPNGAHAVHRTPSENALVLARCKPYNLLELRHKRCVVLCINKQTHK